MSKTETQSEALRLANELQEAIPGFPEPTQLEAAAAAELLRLEAKVSSLECASKEWHEKTDWVRNTIKPRELGMHRADVLRARIEALDAENKSLRERLEAPAVDARAERDAAFESVRKRLCGLQRYSFVLDDDGVVRREQDRIGNWIEFDDAHALFDPVAVDAAIAHQAAAKNGCERTESDANGCGGIDRERMEKAMASETFTLPNGLSESEIVDHFTRAAKEQA